MATEFLIKESSIELEDSTFGLIDTEVEINVLEYTQGITIFKQAGIDPLNTDH